MVNKRDTETMTKGTLFQSQWILGGIAILLIAAIALIASLNGGLAIEFAGLEMTFAQAADGTLKLSLIQAG
jgi:hypothetical protein